MNSPRLLLSLFLLAMIASADTHASRFESTNRLAEKLRHMKRPLSDSIRAFLLKRAIRTGHPVDPHPGLDPKDILLQGIHYPDPLVPQVPVEVTRSDFFQKKYFWRLRHAGKNFLLINFGSRLRLEESSAIQEALVKEGDPKQPIVYRGGELKRVDIFLEQRTRLNREKVRFTYRKAYPHLDSAQLERMLGFDQQNSNSDILLLVETNAQDPQELSLAELSQNALLTVTLARSLSSWIDHREVAEAYSPVLLPYDSKHDRSGDRSEKPNAEREETGLAEISRLVKLKNHSRALRGAVYRKLLELALDPEAPVRELIVLQTEQTARVLGEPLHFERYGTKNELGEFQMRMKVGHGEERFDLFWELSGEWARDVEIDPPLGS